MDEQLVYDESVYHELDTLNTKINSLDNKFETVQNYVYSIDDTLHGIEQYTCNLDAHFRMFIIVIGIIISAYIAYRIIRMIKREFNENIFRIM